MTDEIVYTGVDVMRELADYVEQKYVGDRTIGDLVRWMSEQGLIDKISARNALVRRFYVHQLKYSTPLDARLDCAVNYDISEKTVQSIVYNYKD